MTAAVPRGTQLPGTCVVLADSEILARRAAAWLLNRVLGTPGHAAVCLAGGETPRPIYALLAKSPYRDCFPWDRVHWFWSDERFVPPDNPRSNFGMVQRALFDHVAVPETHIHPIRPVGDPARTAAAYEKELQCFYGTATLVPDRPLFAATLLGIGTNGHTASLFPSAAALCETERWAVAVTETAPEPRITLTYPTLDSSAALAFVVSGAGKRSVLKELVRGANLPAARIRPIGSLIWFIDQAAAP